MTFFIISNEILMFQRFSKNDFLSVNVPAIAWMKVKKLVDHLIDE